MTALKEYEKLESTGLWRETLALQRREVIISFGDTSLMISDGNDAPLSHWSLAAVRCLTPGETPAVYSPNPDGTETLEIDDVAMIAAIEKVRAAIKRRRPHPGRLRVLVLSAIVFATGALGMFWLPEALIGHTVNVVPAEKRLQIGQKLLSHITQYSGVPCNTVLGRKALVKLQKRLFVGPTGTLVIVPQGVSKSTILPGGLVLLNKALIEDFEGPEVAAGYVVMEQVRADMADPMADLLEFAGLTASFRLLTTGKLQSEILQAYAGYLLNQKPQRPPDTPLLDQFARTGFSSAPLAYAIDVTGETTLTLIEADPLRDKPHAPLLSDSDWVSLQGICGG